MNPEAYCEARAAASGSSFYYSFRLLPPERRAAITALYAFCREVDDVVDECSEPGLAAIKLKWWDEEVDRIYDGQPAHPVGQALQRHAARYSLPRDVLHDVVAGMAMDLTRHRYPDDAALAEYCYHAAGTVGILAAHIFGFEDPATLDYARELGHALQLINIIRDVREDAMRGRIYLPQDALARHGISETSLLQADAGDGLAVLLAELAGQARAHHAHALERLPAVDRPAQRTGLVMAAIYLATLDEIERDGFRVLQHRVHLTPLRKFWIAWNTARRERRLARAA
ncbi:MAG: presqualene diphosphate synthase HpnD [Gammaproteobacteria bacterium]|nr:presqualene diphosphate synthase HpnD [Gammaproteobacteria bacterium]